MQQQTIYNRAGQAMVGVLVASVIASISSLLVFKSIRSHSTAERGVASHLDLDEVARTTLMIIDNPNACVISGLLGVDITSLVNAYLTGTNNPPQARDLVNVQLNLGNTIKIGPGAIYGTRSITSTALSTVTSTGAPRSYIGTLDVGTTIIGKNAITSRSPQKRFSVYLETDAANRITYCGGSGGSSGGPVNPPVGTPWSFTVSKDNRGATIPIFKFFDVYNVPAGKTLVIDSVSTTIPEGWVDCSVNDNSVRETLGDYSVSHYRNDPAVGSSYVPMTNSQIFPAGSSVRLGGLSGKLTNGGKRATFTCKFQGYLYDSADYPVPGTFVGLWAFDAPFHPNNVVYTVPAGKTLVLTGNVGSILDNNYTTCTIDFMTGVDFVYDFGQTPGSQHTAITKPLFIPSGSRITLRALANGKGFLNMGKCSWTGYLK